MNELNNNKVEIDTNDCQVIEIEKGRFELFKPIDGYEKYMVSTNGTVISLQFGKIRVLSLRTDKDGYHHATISANGKSKGFLVHRLVMKTFLPEYFNPKLEVDHIDNDRQNNCIENLQMLSHKDNLNKRTKNRKKYVRLSEEEKQFIRDNYIPRDPGMTYSFKGFLKMYEISPQTLKSILYN